MNEILARFFLYQAYFPNLATVVEWALKSTAIIVLGMAVTSLLRNRSARARCWVWRACLMGLFALLIFQFGPAIVKQWRPKVTVSIAQETSLSFWKEITETRMIRTSDAFNPEVKPPVRPKDGSVQAKPPWESEQLDVVTTVKDMRSVTWNWVEMLIPIVWGGVFGMIWLTVLIRTVSGISWLRRKSEVAGGLIAEYSKEIAVLMGIRSRVGIRISREITSPIMFGLVRPTIYLPCDSTGWSREKADIVLLHELAHWKRKDFMWLQIGRLASAVFWWNPLLWTAVRRMNGEAEEAADEIVILHRQKAEEYARTLVEMASVRPSVFQPGVSMLGYRSLEKRVQSLMRENLWRGKVGRLAGIAILVAGLIIVAISSVYVGMASPPPISSEKAVTSVLTADQKKIAERIIKNTEARLTALRFTYIKADIAVSRESQGEVIKSPTDAKVEAWNDSWTNIHRAEGRPNVTLWTDGASPFYISNNTDICNGWESYYFENDSSAEARPREKRAMYYDFLGIEPSRRLIQVLKLMVKATSLKTPGVEFTLDELNWEGKRAVRIQEKMLNNKKVTQQRTLIVIPEDGDLLWFSELSFPESRPDEPMTWTVTKAGQTSEGEFYPMQFTTVSTAQKIKLTKSYTISTFEVLNALPKGIADLPRPVEEQYIAKGAVPVVRDHVAIKCVDPTTGSPVSDVDVKVQINNQTVTSLRTDEAGKLIVSLPKNEVTQLFLTASKVGFCPRTVRWTKYADPLQLPENYEMKLYPGSPISGKVVDQSGKPIPNAEVRMRLTGGMERWSVFCDIFALTNAKTKTDDQGEWSLPDFPQDLTGLSYRVCCDGYQATTDMGISDFLRESGLTYDSLRNGTAVITLKNGAELKGVITDERGKPVPKGRITIGKDIHGSNCPEAESDASGHYVLKGLASGKVWITVEAPALQPVAREIQLPAESAQDFVLKAGKTIAGRVTMPDGSPCAGLNVGVDKWNDLRTLTYSTQTDAEGNFTWTGAPQEPVEFNFGACQSREFLSGLWLHASEEVKSIVMSPGLRFTGSVVDTKTGQPVRSFTVTPGRIVGPRDIYWESQEATTYTGGKFDWKTNRMGGTYVFKIEAPGYQAFQSDQYLANQTVESKNILLQSE